MSEYKLQSNKPTGGVIRLSDGATIPFSKGNRDYTAYLEWVDAGNTPNPAYDAAELDVIRIAEIKAEASARILAILPEVQQRNLIARMVELVDQASLTAEEEAEKIAAKAVWASIKAIRETSNAAETAGTALADIIW